MFKFAAEFGEFGLLDAFVQQESSLCTYNGRQYGQPAGTFVVQIISPETGEIIEATPLQISHFLWVAPFADDED